MELTQVWSNANTEYCTQCGAVLQPDQTFCIQCGAPVATQPQQTMKLQQTVPSTAFCNNCGEPLEPGAAFCIHCGQVIDNPLLANEPPAAFVPLPDHAPTVPIQPLYMVPPVYCTNCGKPVEPSNAYCIHCGAKVENSMPDPGPVYPPDPDSDVPDVPSLDEPIPVLYGPPIHRPPVEPPTIPPVKNPPQPVRPKSLTDEDGNVIDDDPFMVSQLVEITAGEAQSGCRKSVITDDGRTVTVDIPPRANAGTEVDIPGYGLLDPSTGSCGPLRITFYIVRES